MKEAPRTIHGTVIRGIGSAGRLGFPTVNMSRSEYHQSKLQLPRGVYAGVVSIKKSGAVYKAGIVITSDKIEAHLIGYSGDLYGKRIGISFGAYLRKVLAFKDSEKLKAQIRKDLRRVEKLIP